MCSADEKNVASKRESIPAHPQCWRPLPKRQRAVSAQKFTFRFDSLTTHVFHHRNTRAPRPPARPECICNFSSPLRFAFAHKVTDPRYRNSTGLRRVATHLIKVTAVVRGHVAAAGQPMSKFDPRCERRNSRHTFRIRINHNLPPLTFTAGPETMENV